MEGQGLSFQSFVNNIGDVRSTQCTSLLSNLWYIAQIAAGLTILTLEWSEPCDQKLALWLTVAIARVGIRLLLSGAVLKLTWGIHSGENDEQDGDVETAEQVPLLEKMKEILDVFGLVWFTLGNAWVFGAKTCRSTAPGIFYLCLAIIVITYLIMLFPIILAVLLIPFACFCLPCFLRLLVRFREMESPRGATRAQIGSIPTVKYRPGVLGDESDNTCPICLAEYNDGETLRKLRCSGNHHFHAGCVDQWLHLNSVCPCCREPVFSAETRSSSFGSRSGRRIEERAAADRDLERRLSAMEADRHWTAFQSNDSVFSSAHGNHPIPISETEAQAAASGSGNATNGGDRREGLQDAAAVAGGRYTEHGRIVLRALMTGLLGRLGGSGSGQVREERRDEARGVGPRLPAQAERSTIPATMHYPPLIEQATNSFLRAVPVRWSGTLSPDNSWFDEDVEGHDGDLITRPGQAGPNPETERPMPLVPEAWQRERRSQILPNGTRNWHLQATIEPPGISGRASGIPESPAVGGSSRVPLEVEVEEGEGKVREDCKEEGKGMNVFERIGAVG